MNQLPERAIGRMTVGQTGIDLSTGRAFTVLAVPSPMDATREVKTTDGWFDESYPVQAD